MLENGNDIENKTAKKYLENRKKIGDKQATKIIEDYEKNNPTEKK